MQPSELQQEALSERTANHDILPIFHGRWSPRAMDGTPLSREELHTVLEAARWAPSSYNEQEWRFIYALAGTPHFDRLLGFLVEQNQAWCRRAGALIHVSARTTFVKNEKPNSCYSFDSGLATQNLLLQAASMNLVSHAMVGFDKPASMTGLDIPKGFEPQCMIALGHRGDVDALPDALRELESPNDRKPLSEIACEGTFGFDGDALRPDPT